MASNLTSLSKHRDKQFKTLTTMEQVATAWQQSEDAFSRLGRRINTTLELSEQLNFFAEALQDVVPYQRLTYGYNGQEGRFDWENGEGGRHSCQYTLHLEGENFGDIRVARHDRFTEREMAAIETMLGLLIHPLRNAHRFLAVQRDSLTCPVTRIANKRAFEQAIRKEASLGNRHGDQCALILCDLDHFKQVNDQHGHKVGDDLLVAVASALESATRETDSVFRIGGEEFAVILPRIDSVDTVHVSDRIRQTIADIRLRTAEGTVYVTASAGLSVHAPNEHVDSWFERTDSALYQAKREGRNQTRVAVPPIPVSIRTMRHDDEDAG